MKTTGQYYHIAIAADRNFSVPLALACESILRNAKDGQRYHIHILGLDIEEQIVRDLQTRCDARKFRLSYHDVTSLLEGLADHDYFPPATYARFLLPDILSTQVDRVLYIDADVMLCRDIEALFEVELGDALLAGVEELSIAYSAYFVQHVESVREHFNVTQEEMPRYYYAGQFVMNLPEWRRENMGRRCIELGRNLPEKFIYKDQDILNGLCRGRVVTLPLSYCVSPHMYPIYQRIAKGELEDGFSTVYTPQDAERALHHPSLLHFMTAYKPCTLYPPLYGYAPFYQLWRSSPWKHRLPYIPKKLQELVDMRVVKYQLMHTWMQKLCNIPFGYECWWMLMKCVPAVLRSRVLKQINWITPEHYTKMSQ